MRVWKGVRQGDVHKGRKKKKKVLFPNRSATKQALKWIRSLLFLPDKEAVTQASERLESCNTVKVIVIGRSQRGGCEFQPG